MRTMGWLVAAVVVLSSCRIFHPGPPPADFSKGGRIHVAAIQTTLPDEDGDAVEITLERLIREAAGRGARYILLPEYYPGQLDTSSGATLETIRAGAQPLDGAIARHMLDLCKELDVYIGFPLAERRENGDVYNSTVYAGPRGIDGVYSKKVLIRAAAGEPLGEADIYKPGKTDGVLTWGGVRIGALICADGGFPAFYQSRRASGVQIFFHASGSAGAKAGENNPMPDTAAKRYQRPVVFANHWKNRILYQGNSQICDAEGRVLAHVGPQPNVVVDAVVDLPPVE